MRKTLLFWLTFSFAIIIATYLSVRIVMLVTGHLDAAGIKTVSVSSKNGGLDKSAVARVVNIAPNTPTYGVRLDDILARILTVPDIDDAGVRRMPNGSIQIRVRMRTIIAAWTDGEYYYPLGANGVKIDRPSDDRPEKSLVFRGNLPDDIGQITAAVINAPKIMAAVDYLEWIDARRWNLVMKSGATVQLPEKNATVAINALADLDKKTNILTREIKTLDLRDQERTFVKI